MNRIELLEGLIQADFAETLAAVAGRADLIVTSPPYEDARTYGADVAWTFEDYQRLGDAVAAALRPDGGQCLMVLGGSVRDFRGDGWTERSVMPYRVLLDWRDRLGLVTPDVYVYIRDGQPGQWKGRQRNNWEPLLWFATPGERTFHALIRPSVYPAKSGAFVQPEGKRGASTQAVIAKKRRTTPIAWSTLGTYCPTVTSAARQALPADQQPKPTTRPAFPTASPPTSWRASRTLGTSSSTRSSAQGRPSSRRSTAGGASSVATSWRATATECPGST